MDPDRALVHNDYQREYFERGQRTLEPTGSLYLRRHVDRMMDYAGVAAGDRVLEIGCGLGRYTLLLAERGVAVEGMDLSAALLDRLRESAPPGRTIPTHAGDIADAPPDLEEQFDAVIGFFVLHHVHGLDACLARAARLVRPGGRIAFLEPNPFNPLYYVQIALTPEMRWAGERGMLRMRPEPMREALASAGVQPMPVVRFGYFPPFVTNRRLGARLEDGLEKVPMWSFAHPFQLFGAERAS